MENAVNEHVIQLCALAAIEQDSKKLLVLVEEINRLLEQKEQQLKAQRPASKGA